MPRGWGWVDDDPKYEQCVKYFWLHVLIDLVSDFHKTQPPLGRCVFLTAPQRTCYYRWRLTDVLSVAMITLRFGSGSWERWTLFRYPD